MLLGTMRQATTGLWAGPGKGSPATPGPPLGDARLRRTTQGGRAMKAATIPEVATAREAGRASIPYRVTDATIRDIQSLYKSCLYEYDYQVEEAWVEGEIPQELVGTYFRNGPGLQVNNPRYKRHTFDGDGMILSFSFKDGSVRFKNKFIRTKGFEDEQAAGKPVYRTAFTRGSADGNPIFNPFDFQLKNCANTGVLYWGGRLLALYESGLPHELRPQDLSTVGESTVGSALETPVLAAHYRVMVDEDGTKSWVAFSANSGLSGTEMLFYEFAEDGGLRHAPTLYPLKDTSLAMVHDIAVSEDYYVVVIGPINFSPLKFMTEYFLSRCSIAECLVYDPSKPTHIHLVPRPKAAAAGVQPRIIEAPAMFTFHHANAYQLSVPAGGGPSSSSGSSSTGDRQLLVLDTVGWDTISFDANQYNLGTEYYKGGARTNLKRMVFDLGQEVDPASSSSSGGGGGRLVGEHTLVQRCTEFPSVAWDSHGKPHRYLYCCGDLVDDPLYWGPAQAVLKVEVDPAAGAQGPLTPGAVQVDVWSAGTRCIVNEPLFVPRPGGSSEDDGWVLVTVHNGATDKGDLVILDARDLSQEPLATIHLPHFLPAGLHGSWCPRLFEDDSSAEPRWREPNVVKGL